MKRVEVQREGETCFPRNARGRDVSFKERRGERRCGGEGWMRGRSCCVFGKRSDTRARENDLLTTTRLRWQRKQSPFVPSGAAEYSAATAGFEEKVPMVAMLSDVYGIRTFCSTGWKASLLHVKRKRGSHPGGGACYLCGKARMAGRTVGKRATTSGGCVDR